MVKNMRKLYKTRRDKCATNTVIFEIIYEKIARQKRDKFRLF